MANTKYNYKNLKQDFDKNKLQNLLIDEGYTYRELQSLYKYNERLWSRLAKEYGIPKQKHNIVRHSVEACTKTVSIEQIEQIIELYMNQHKSLREISKALGVSRELVKKHLIANNIEIRPFNDSHYYTNRNRKRRKRIDTSGYVCQGRDRQHRKVAEEQLKRPLFPQEVVHHIDHNKTNNNPDNLYVFPNESSHTLFHGQHWTNDPDEFVEYYKTTLLHTLYDYNWMYYHYITLRQSVSGISKTLKVGRVSVTNKLKEFNIYDLRERSVNQFDT